MEFPNARELSPGKYGRRLVNKTVGRKGGGNSGSAAKSTRIVPSLTGKPLAELQARDLSISKDNKKVLIIDGHGGRHWMLLSECVELKKKYPSLSEYFKQTT